MHRVEPRPSDPTLSQENLTWGAPRIQSELALMAHEVAESTVAKFDIAIPKEHSVGGPSSETTCP